ncbi:MAG: hypothetical protein K6A05_06835 [Lachnospiraceae bacterium]|nr:hypothetical protein [Lachnospiraceae bacterium]
MKMKFATISRSTNKVMGMFDAEYEAYDAMMKYIAEDRANNLNTCNDYFVRMMILDSNDQVVIQGTNC